MPTDIKAQPTQIGEGIEFIFTDNPDWRSKVQAINGRFDGTLFYFGIFDNSKPGALIVDKALLSLNSSNQKGMFTLTISATGYQDIVVTMELK